MSASIPEIFAIYRPELEKFQILQVSKDSDGSILRLKNWARPYAKDWATAGPAEKTRILPWFHGQEWYVVPTERVRPIVQHPVTIHNQNYNYFSMNHELVWSDVHTYTHRQDSVRAAMSWESAPRIPVLALSSKLIYPRSDVSFYARWSESSPEAMLEEMSAGIGRPYKLELSIRTPVYHATDDEWEAVHGHVPKGAYCCEDYACLTGEKEERREPSCAAYFVLGLMGAGMVALYGFSISLALGY